MGNAPPFVKPVVGLVVKETIGILALSVAVGAVHAAIAVEPVVLVNTKCMEHTMQLCACLSCDHVMPLRRIDPRQTLLLFNSTIIFDPASCLFGLRFCAWLSCCYFDFMAWQLNKKQQYVPVEMVNP